jgi:hypothetical protein
VTGLTIDPCRAGILIRINQTLNRTTPPQRSIFARWRWFSCRAPEISPARRVVGLRKAPVQSRLVYVRPRPLYIQRLSLMPDRRNHGHMNVRQKKITFGEMREAGVDHVLIYCSDYKCSHSTEMHAGQWTDDVTVSDIEDRFGALTGFARDMAERSGRDATLPDGGWVLVMTAIDDAIRGMSGRGQQKHHRCLDGTSDE